MFALGLPASLIDEAVVWKALARAQLEDFVRSLPEQLDTEVGENGTRLSGGQQQRVVWRGRFTRSPDS